jgi:inosine/xanthosine triphosphate pyrophosphatase family protein
MLIKKIILGLFIIAVSVGLLSCKPSVPTSGLFSEPVASIEIYRFLRYTNKLDCYNLVADSKYVLPSTEWIKGPYTERFDKILFDNGLKLALEEANDCDDFARSGKFASTVAYLNDKNRTYKTALAFGECNYIPDNLLGVGKNDNFIWHAINFFITTENGQWKLKFYEPQTRQLIELNDVEKSTINYFEL